MKAWLNFLVTLLFTICCAGCQTDARECGYLEGGYAPLDSKIIHGLEPYALDRIPQSIVNDIRNCWAMNPYGGDTQHSLELVEAREVSPTQHYVIFEPRGITDVKLAFLVDSEKGVIRAYEYSLL